MEKKTLKETLVKIYNETLERYARFFIDIDYFTAKAQTYKKKSPEYIAEMERVTKSEADMYWGKLLLKTIEKLIADIK